MKRLGPAGTILVLTILAVWAYILFAPNDRPDMFGPLSGCYRGRGPLAAVKMTISPPGRLDVQNESFTVKIVQDKIGFSLLPDRRITYDPAIPNYLAIEHANPLLMRISDDHRSITIPAAVAGVVFEKATCSAAPAG